MKICLLVVGKSTNSNFIAIQENYISRLKHYITFELTVVPELKNIKNLPIAEQKSKEGELICKFLQVNDEVVLLDENGKQLSSAGFSEYLSKRMLNSQKRMVFVVGGPYGFSEQVYERANDKLSLSAMTFSHQMIRPIFVEQLYRAMTIIKGESYHHE
jgi:23S rRNA (pseudouridine1915-N3)-methyltransferase